MATTVIVKCDNCGNVFEKPLKFYNLSKKLNAKQFCTRDCYLQYHNDISNLIILCPNCHKYLTKKIYTIDELKTLNN